MIDLTRSCFAFPKRSAQTAIWFGDLVVVVRGDFLSSCLSGVWFCAASRCFFISNRNDVVPKKCLSKTCRSIQWQCASKDLLGFWTALYIERISSCQKLFRKVGAFCDPFWNTWQCHVTCMILVDSSFRLSEKERIHGVFRTVSSGGIIVSVPKLDHGGQGLLQRLIMFITLSRWLFCRLLGIVYLFCFNFGFIFDCKISRFLCGVLGCNPGWGLALGFYYNVKWYLSLCIIIKSFLLW